MKILVASYKGGVGKSSLSYNMAQFMGAAYVTNDTISIDDPAIHQIEPRLKRIPEELFFEDDDNTHVVFDFGAMSTNIDPKVTHALQNVDLVVIPTLTDLRSLKATIDFVRFIESAHVPFVIIVNNFKQQKKYEHVEDVICDALGEVPILPIKHTTLFERIAECGQNWQHNVHHQRGMGRLLKTQKQHEEIYMQMFELAGFYETTDD